MTTYMDAEQRIIQYESNIIKQAFYNNEIISTLRDKIEDGFFSNQFRSVIWKSYLFIIDNGEQLTKSTIEDVLINSGNEKQIERFWELIHNKYNDEEQWRYQHKYLYEVFTKTKILRIINEARDKMPTQSSTQIIDTIIEELSKYDIREEPSYNTKESIKRALLEITDRDEGRIVPFIRTGYDKFDILAKLDFNKIILIAAAKKIGKTKWVLNMIMEILEIDPTIAVKLYSLELSEKEVMYEIISRDVNLTTDEIQSKGYKLTNANKEAIHKSMERFDSLDISINTRPTTIGKVKKDFVKFCKQRNTHRCILIVDNIGLLSDTGNTQTEIDDHIAKVFVDIRDRTKALILPIHHMGKELEKPERIKDGYRPRLSHLKGSTRIGDYANMIILLHRPGFYEDLVAREEVKDNIKLHLGNFRRSELIRRIFIVNVAINRSGDTGVLHFLHKLKYCQFKEF